MTNHFSPAAAGALNSALEFADELGHTYIGSEHLLLGLLSQKGAAADFLTKRGITFAASRNLIISLSGTGNRTDLSPADMTPRTKAILEAAAKCAAETASDSAPPKNTGGFIATEHLLYALVCECQSVGAGLLTAQGASLSELKADLAAYLKSGPERTTVYRGKPTPVKQTALAKYGKNLTALAAEGRLDRVIGRDREIMQVIYVLSRRSKNNPCLIGEPGVGKTAIVEGLAARIADREVPDLLEDKQIYSLELSSLVAGAKYRGEFEERMRQVVEEASNDSSVILFIDEIHTLIGAGSAEGAVDAANILKPALARGQISLIGATTLSEYRKIEKDAALERRFQPVTIKEPSPEETIAILQGVKDTFEAHHKLRIGEDAIKAAVELSVRYLPDRRLPDKALDLLDEACACQRVRSATPPEAVKRLEEAVFSLKGEKEEAIRGQHFEEAAALRDREAEAKTKWQSAKAAWQRESGDSSPEIGADEIAEALTARTGIPVSVRDGELTDLQARLDARIIGQTKATAALAAATLRSVAGIRDEKRPAGSFLLTGPTGTGKSELTRVFAEEIFGSRSALIRLDMSEMREAQSVAKLIGSPPGYVGYDEGGQLTEKIRRTPSAVVVFDEVEKAHPAVLNLLLQILEEGCLTDSTSRRANFRSAYIFLTSNATSAQHRATAPVGFRSDIAQAERFAKRVQAEATLRKTFPPELLARIDEIIVFEPLSDDSLRQIALLQLNELKKRLSGRVCLTFSDDLPTKLIDSGDRDERSEKNARAIRSAIRQRIEDPLAVYLLGHPIPSGVSLRLSFDGNTLRFEPQGDGITQVNP